MPTRSPLTIVMLCTAVLCLSGFAFSVRADEPAEPVKFGPWEVLYRGSSKQTSKKPEFGKSNLKVIESFELDGEKKKDPFRFNQLRLDGNWAITQGVLHQAEGRSAALSLGEAEDFELEIGMNAEGEGGWFLLFGYSEGNGQGLYNVNLRQSGSPWFVIRFARGEGVVDSDQEVARYECRGAEPLLVKVVNGRLSAQISRRTLIEDHELTDYKAGEIILGTYDTNYGPKPLKLMGIRIRRPKES